MNEIRALGIEALEVGKKKIADGLKKASLKSIFRSELVFWETKLRPFCVDDYYDVIAEILSRAGHPNVTKEHIGVNLTLAAREIGFDRKTRILDGRRATMRGVAHE